MTDKQAKDSSMQVVRNTVFIEQTKTPAQVLLALPGSWQDKRSTDEIIADLRKFHQSNKPSRFC